jgi:hypothetical protein
MTRITILSPIRGLDANVLECIRNGSNTMKRRSVQSYVEISRFPLDESGFPSAEITPFLSYRIRDKNPQEQGGQ